MEVTVGYGRKLHPGHDSYEFASEEASVFFRLQEGDTEGRDFAQVKELVDNLFAQVKTTVLDQLGLPWEQYEGVVREHVPAAAVAAAFPGAVAQAQPGVGVPPAAAPAAPVSPIGGIAPPPAAPIGAAAPVPAAALAMPPNLPYTGDAEKDALIADINANPQNWYDNRARKTNPKAPDFKHKTVPDPKGGFFNGKPNMLAAWVTAR